MKTCCFPGEMLCPACLAEDEDPPTVRNPPKTTYAFVGSSLPIYRGILPNPPAIRQTHIPIFIEE